MDISLHRLYSGPDGILSVAYDDKDDEIFVSLEHAYQVGDLWIPKIPDGTYECVRGDHRLKKMTTSFSTFMVTGVPLHSGLLFHCGNFDEDSDGCILIGEDPKSIDGRFMITNSRASFDRFMKMQAGVDLFRMTVVGGGID